MIVVLLFAIALMALKDRIVPGAGIAYAIMACVLLASVIGAILFRGGTQVASIALAAFLAGYLLNAIKYQTLRPPYLVLSTVFDRCIRSPGVAPHPSTPPVLDSFRLAINTFMATLVTVFGSILARTLTIEIDDPRPSK